MYRPTISQVSAPSRLLLVMSKSVLLRLHQGSLLLYSSDLFACRIISFSDDVMLSYFDVNFIAFSSSCSVMGKTHIRRSI